MSRLQGGRPNDTCIEYVNRDKFLLAKGNEFVMAVTVHGHSLEHHPLHPGCIHQNFAKQYNDLTDLILLSIGK